jgi:hypothetical protein
MMRGAINHFGKIQGGVVGESPEWALTMEPTPEFAKMVVVQRIARLFAGHSVALSRRDRWQISPRDRALCAAKIRSNATYQSF